MAVQNYTMQDKTVSTGRDYQYEMLQDQENAMREGFDWRPSGWQEKQDPNAVSWFDEKNKKNTSGSGGNQSPTLMQANYTQEQFDPWSKFRAASGEKLNSQINNDPSNIYRDRLKDMVSPGGGQFATSDPSYLFRLEQGQQAAERSLAARGLLNSGNAAIELQQYGQQSASQEYGAQFDRLLKGMSGTSQQFDTQMQRLMTMAGVNNDPTAAARMNLGVEGENTSRMANANNYNLGMTNATNNRYATDTASRTASRSSSRGGTSFGSSADMPKKIKITI
jgi:hypothetical protein